MALALAACGGTTGREDVPPVGNGPEDATSGDPFDLDGGPFDVTIAYVDRILPEVGPPPLVVDAGDGGDAAPTSAWPCPPDILVFDEDAGCTDDAGAEGGCVGVPTAAAYDDAGGVTAAPAGSLCATCAPFNGGAGCTPTEQAFIEHDPSGECYTCLVNNGGLDDLLFPDVGHECADLPVLAQISAAQNSALCMSTLQCILGTTPNAPTCALNGSASYCYCGAANDPAACASLTPANPPNGACVQQEADGLLLPVLPTIPVLKAYDNGTLGSGIANAIFAVAQTNHCTSCF